MKTSKRNIPDPPPAGADNLSKLEAAGFFRITLRRLDELRRSDPAFPKPMLLSTGTPRWRRAELDDYLSGRPRGWCSSGGLREGAFGRNAGDAGLVELYGEENVRGGLARLSDPDTPPPSREDA